jgi:hypothetical protein
LLHGDLLSESLDGRRLCPDGGRHFRNHIL